MSIHHLRELRAALEQNHWTVVEELPGNDFDISGVWRIARPDGSQVFYLEFQGRDDLRALPMEDAYGIKIREAPEVGAYFARVGRTWPAELGRFISNLNRWASESPGQ